MLGSLLKKFLGIGRSEGGNVLIIVAFASVILITAIGAAIDFSRTSIVRQNQDNAMDLAKRAANNYCTNPNNTIATSDATAMQNCISAQINKYFYANAKTNIAGSTLNAAGNQLNVSVNNNGNNGAVQADSSAQVTSDLIKSNTPPDLGTLSGSVTEQIPPPNPNPTPNGGSSSSTQSTPITTTLITGVDNVAWRGVCDNSAGKTGHCLVGISDWQTGQTAWHCTGQNGGSTANCPTNTPINGVCGTSAGACGDGSIQAVTNYSWICPGTGTGSSSAICNIGTCSSSPITANQCTSGIAISSLTTGTTTTWVCQGSNVSLNSGVCRYTPPNSSEGICDTTFNKCIYGTSTNQDEASKTWQCEGEAGNAANCSIATNGECGTEDNGAGSCAAGTVQDYVVSTNGSGATWNCVGTSCGYTASCGSVYGQCGTYSGVIPTPSNASSVLGICASGSATILGNYFNSSAGQGWECNGTGGIVTGNNQNAVSCINWTCNNPPTPSADVACESTYTNNAYGTTHENYSCDATTGILDTIDTSTTCTSKTANCTVTPTPTVSVSVCPRPYYSSGTITTTTPYSCVKGQPNYQLLEGAKTVSNTCVQATPTCVAGNKRTVACDSTGVNFTGSKTQIEECPNGDFGTPTWYDNDTSACVAVTVSVCTNSKAVSCQAIYGTNYYDNSTTNPQLGVTETQSCSDNGGTVSCGNWTLPTTPPDNCVACTNMNINYWVRTPIGLITFNSNDQGIFEEADAGDPINAGVVNCTLNSNAKWIYYEPYFGNMSGSGCVNNSGPVTVHTDKYGTAVDNKIEGADTDFGGNSIAAIEVMYMTSDQVVSLYKAAKAANPTLDSNDPNAVANCPSSYFVLLEDNILSPLKVNIAGGNAKLNSDRSIQFSQTQKDGSKKIITTYGSLNPDEAWLMLDRDGEGLINNGVINGDNFFTDHDGVKNDAYHDLAKTFALFVKTDENGHNYIPLHKITEQEKLDEIEDKKIRVDKRIGAVREMVPSYHLKLLDANNNEFYASDYFDRIYVEKRDVSVADEIHKNIILEIAPVRTLDGKYHLSADQWFVPKQ